MNPDAAKFVFSKAAAFSHFVAIPADTTKRVKYALAGLTRETSSLDTRYLGFNCRVEPMKVATGEVTVKDFHDQAYTMPDLTALLCCFLPGFAGSTPTRAILHDINGTLTLVPETSGVRVYKLEQDVSLSEREILDILSTLAVDGEPLK